MSVSAVGKSVARACNAVTIFAVGVFVMLLLGSGLLYTIIEMRGMYSQAAKRRSDG